MLALCAALACILVNAFFVAVEFSLAKVRPTALEALAKAGDASAARALEITRQLPAYLSATQLGITLASLSLGWLGEPAMTDLLAPVFDALHVQHAIAERVAIALAFAVISGLHIIVGELVPKTLAITRAEQIARRTSLTLRAFYLVTYPALWLLNGASRVVLRGLGLTAPDHAEGRLSLDELRLVIRDGVVDEDPTRRAILERVLRATGRPVGSIMVPRPDVHVLSLDDDPERWMATVRRFGFSRYPVSADGNVDGIVGYVYVKDLLMRRSRRRPKAVAAMRRDILRVGPSCTLSQLLERFERSAIPIALVVDDDGKTLGLVTIEDVVLELVGDLRGELGCARGGVWVDDDNQTVADGRALLCDVYLEGAALALPGETSVAAWIVGRLGRPANQGDVVTLGDWEAVVDEVRARRVHRVRFRPRHMESSESGDQACTSRVENPAITMTSSEPTTLPTRPAAWTAKSGRP